MATFGYHHASHVEVQVESHENEAEACRRPKTLPGSATTLEKEKAEIPRAKCCKIQCDVKKHVDRAIYDNVRSLSNNQIYIKIRDGFTIMDRLTRDKDLADKKCLTTGKNSIVSFASSILAFRHGFRCAS